MGKKVETMLVMINQKIENAIKTYADAHDFQLIMAYGEPATPLPVLQAFQRKMKVIDAGGTILLHTSKHLDISDSVLKMLNDK